MPRIDPYMHTCVVQTGPAAGNKVRTKVTRWDVEFGEKCEFCGEPLATIEQLVLHIYGELTEE